MPLKVLVLAESPYLGGITSHILSMYHALGHRPEVDVVFATLPGRRDDSALQSAFEQLDVPLHEFQMSSRFDLGVLRRLRDFVTASEIDLVHTHNYRSTLVAALARLPVPTITTAHGLIAETSWKLGTWKWLELQAMKRHGFTIACSHYVRDWLLTYDLEFDRLRVVHNAYQPVSIREDRQLTRESLGMDADTIVVSYIGRLVPEKQVDVLLTAMAELPGYTALIVGDGPERERLPALASNLGVSAVFAGAVSEPSAYYHLSDVVALPSKEEALPMTLIEAAAYARPAVASDVGGVPEVVDAGRTGILVEPGNAEQLRNALERLGDTEVRAEMGQAAWERWSELFSPQRLGDDLVRIYQEVVAPS